MRAKDRARLFYEIAKLLEAGVSFSGAMGVVTRHWKSARMAEWAAGMEKKLSDNVSVAEAFAADPRARVWEVNLVRAGERSGQIEAVFSQMAVYYERMGLAESRIFKASVYPLMLAHVVIFLDFVKVWFTAPGLSAWYHFGFRLSLLWAVLLAVWLAVGFVVRVSQTSWQVDRVLDWLPLLGAVRRSWALARFASVFSAGLRAGLLVTETIQLACTASGRALVELCSSRAVESIQMGGTVGETLGATGLFPEAFVAAVSTAEQAGGLDREMGRLAAWQWSIAEDRVRRLEEWLPKIGYFMVMLWMVFNIFSSFQKYLSYLGVASGVMEGDM